MTSISAVVAVAARRLGSQAEARTLVAHVLGVDLGRLLLADPPDAAASARLDGLVARRLTGVPLQHLTGEAWFRTVRVEVGPGVFIPRPETEVMTGWALTHLATLAQQRSAAVGDPAAASEVAEATPRRPVVVELCAGSGAISLALATEFPDAAYHCVELSEDAWPYLRRNLAGTDVEARLGDMADAFGELDGRVDLVVANPPYIPLDEYEGVTAEVRDHDPAVALFSGRDGLDALRLVAKVAARLLHPGGWVCAEHADSQGEAAPEVFVRHGGFARVADHVDLNGRPRFVAARRAGRMGP